MHPVDLDRWGRGVSVMAWKAARDSCGARPVSPRCAVVIVFLDPLGDASPCVVEALALVDPDLLF